MPLTESNAWLLAGAVHENKVEPFATKPDVPTLEEWIESPEGAAAQKLLKTVGTSIGCGGLSCGNTHTTNLFTGKGFVQKVVTMDYSKRESGAERVTIKPLDADEFFTKRYEDIHRKKPTAKKLVKASKAFVVELRKILNALSVTIMHNHYTGKWPGEDLGRLTSYIPKIERDPDSHWQYS